MNNAPITSANEERIGTFLADTKGMPILASGYGLLGLAVISIFAIYWLLLRAPNILRNGIPIRKPPNTLPLIGNGLLFLQDRQKLFAWFAQCEREVFGHETFQITVPTLHPGVVITSPENLDYVFRNEGVFSKGNFVRHRSWDLFGDGIINADGALWRAQRRAGTHFLNAQNLRVLTDVALPRYLGRTVGQLHEQAGGDDRKVVDLQLVFHEITSQLMGKLAYDMEMHANDDFTVAFEHASGIITERFQNPLWFITEIFTGSRFRRSVAVVRKFGSDIVNNAVEGRQKKPKPSTAAAADSSLPHSADGDGDQQQQQQQLDEVSGSLIQSLLKSLGAQKQQHKLVADAALTFLTAGRDTTAQALTWCLYLLMRNRPAMQRIRSEAEDLLKTQRLSLSLTNFNGVDNSSSSSSSAIFTPSSLPYTMAAFYETLRLYPPIPFEIRQCEQATTLPDGTFLPDKSVVLWSLWAMGRSVTTWGADVDMFRPERWLDDDGRLVTKGPSEFPAFYGGQRTCLGKRMAEIIATQVIATVILLFDFDPAYKGERASKTSLTLPMRDGLPCYVTYRL